MDLSSGLRQLNNLLFGLKLSNNMKKCFNMWLKCHKRGEADLGLSEYLWGEGGGEIKTIISTVH